MLSSKHPLYIDFIDFKKAFDNAKWNKLWNILRHYNIPDNFVNIIQELYDRSTCCIAESGWTSDWFPVETGVKQGCIMSGFLFNITIDWIMKKTLDERPGLWWQLITVLEDLDYAEEIALLSSQQKDLQEKCSHLHQASRYTGTLHHHQDKGATKECQGHRGNFHWWTRSWRRQLLHLPRSHSPWRRRITWRHHTQAVNHKRAYASLNPVWRSKMYRKHTKLRILKSCVTSVLLYGTEMWRITSWHCIAKRFPLKMSQENPLHILATHHLESWPL